MPITAPDRDLHDNFFSSLPVILAIFFCSLISGCASAIGSTTLHERLTETPGSLVLIDVRSRSEYNSGHLPGAVNIPVHALPFRLEEVSVKGKDQPVVVYCGHGPRAGLAGFILKVAGFKDVRSLRGSISAWNSGGLPLEEP
jgi:rhodanese-related sulfurtransferase